jgi:hypothetical protein
MIVENGLSFIENKIGFFIHSIWLNKQNPFQKPPLKFSNFLESWKILHPQEDIIHILWNGNLANEFFSIHHPDKFKFYKSLPTEAQQSDFLRLLLLYAYGGIYIDIDQECKYPFIHDLINIQYKHVILLKSPLFTEEYTNCLMAALSTQHEFWLEVINIVENNVKSIQNGKGCSKTCALFFGIPLIGSQIQILFTHNITGPSCLDRAIARVPIYGDIIHSLLASDFYDGKYAVHHENGQWFSSNTVKMSYVASILVIVSFFVYIL